MTQSFDFDTLRTKQLRAEKLNKVDGKQFYRVPVRILFNNSGQCRTDLVRIVSVIARNATDAANLVRDEYSWRPETEVFAYGPKGGEVYRYVGFYSFIADGLFGNGGNRQSSLALVAEVSS